MKPGVTGPWAVHEMPASLDDEMQMNLLYIRNYTIWMDLEITARSLFRYMIHPAAPNQKNLDVALRSGDGAWGLGTLSPSNGSKSRAPIEGEVHRS